MIHDIAIADNIGEVRQRIERAARSCGRDPSRIDLLAVSKTKPASLLRQAHQLGLRAFGESYLQEAQVKIADLADLPVEWHFIGRIQSKKCKTIATLFDWVQSVDRLSVAEKLNRHRIGARPLNILIQVNPQGEPGKGGVAISETRALVRQIFDYPYLQIRGLMCIPGTDPQSRHHSFCAMRELYCQMQQEFQHVDTLSMGMSMDLVDAITCGSTMVRIGTALFGPRDGCSPAEAHDHGGPP